MRAWEEFLTLKEKELGTETVRRWLRTLKVGDFDAGNLYLEAKDHFQVMWFKEHVKKSVEAELVNNSGKQIRVHLSVAGAKGRNGKGKSAPKKKEEAGPAPFVLTFDELDPNCTFDTYVPTGQDELCLKVLTQMCSGEMELCTFNPIYLSGPTGAGKSHMLMATAHAMKERGLKVIYARAETFTEHVVTAIRAGEMHRFREAYRHTDLLLIDNVQVFSRKNATQEELFHTFNALHVGGKQIILSANCNPSELQFVEPRLVSRFEWGIVLPVGAAPKDKLRAVLEKKASSLDFTLEKRVIDYLLETFPSGSSALMRALEALILRVHLSRSSGNFRGNAVSVVLAKEMLRDLVKEEEQYVLTPEKIIDTVADMYGMDQEDLLGPSQRRDCVVPRKLAMYLCRSQLKMPYMRIGETFSRDHSTVMTSVKQIEKKMDDPELSGMVHAINKKLTELGAA